VELNDPALIDEILAGSGVAFELLMRRYERLVYRVAFYHLSHYENALDVTQNVFLKVHRKLGSLRAKQQFRPWLLRITFHESLNWRRSQKHHDSLEDLETRRFSSEETNQERDLVLEERRHHLWAGLDVLNPKQRLVVLLRYFENMSVREIAAVMKCSEAMVKNRLFRSLKKLRHHLSPVLEERT